MDELGHVLPLLIPIVAIVSWAAVMVFRGPLGQALAQRLSGASSGHDAELAALREEVAQFRGELTEVQERMDFAERLLAKEREGARLAPGGGDGHA